ncbi:MAG: hypothetical protein ACPGRY_16545, partial [Candidatus Latescibacterota bacterium]
MRIARLAVSAFAVASLCFSASPAQAQSDKDIVDTAVEAGTFNTLAAAHNEDKFVITAAQEERMNSVIAGVTRDEFG